MKISKTLAFVALSAALLLAAWWWLPRGTPVEVAVVRQGDLRQTVVMSGRLTSVQRNDIAAQNTARIETVEVREGDSVRAGQVLVRLRDDEAQAAVAQAASAVEEAQASAARQQRTLTAVTEQQLAQAVAADRQAQAEFQRARDLQSQGFVSQSRVDDARRAALTSASALLAAQAQAEGNRSGGPDATLVQARLTQTRSALTAARARLDQLVLRAPAAATVLIRHAEPGDTAQPGRVLISLTASSETLVVANVDEKNLSLLAVGQSAAISTDAFPARPFAARVTYIAPSVDPLRGTVEVRLNVPAPPDFLRTDMTASVEIVTAERRSVLLLPSEAIRLENQKPYVLLNRDRKAARSEVTLGVNGVGTVEITGGLSAGDRVILPGTTVTEGSTIREQGERSPKANVPNMPGFTS